MIQLNFDNLLKLRSYRWCLSKNSLLWSVEESFLLPPLHMRQLSIKPKISLENFTFPHFNIVFWLVKQTICAFTTHVPSVPCSENIEQSPSVSWPREFYPSPPTVGDWNGVGRLQSDRLGHLRHLKTKTAQSGLEQRRWLANITMQCIDQSHAIGTRGNTQAIKINKTWYELDLFCGDDRILNHTQSLRISTLSISDHRAKQIVLHLPPTSGQTARAKALRIQDAQVSNRPS